MCHHGDAAYEAWYHDQETEEESDDEELSFVNEEADVDVDLLEADD